MQQPPGQSQKVCKFNKAIYGLKHSTRVWFETFTNNLLDFGFVRCLSEYLVFVRRTYKGSIFVIVYVDDIVLTSNDQIGIQETKMWLNSKLQIKDLGQLQYFLGIEVTRTHEGIYLSQEISCGHAC